MPFTIGISTYSSVQGTAGGPSIVFDMRDSAAAHRVFYEASVAETGGALTALTSLQPLESSVCEMMDREAATGALSGSKGKGGVHAALLSVCESVRAIIGTLADTVERTEARREVAAGILADLQAIPNDTSLNVFERQAAFRVKADALYRVIEELGAENIADRLRAQLDIAEASIISLGVKDGAFGQKQSGLIASLKASVEQVRDIVGGLMVAGGDEPPPPPPLLDMGAAVFAHWDKNLPAIAIAVLSDVMAVWFTAYLMVVTGRLDAIRRSHRAQLAKRRRKPATAKS